jgi:hypothetical protein
VDLDPGSRIGCLFDPWIRDPGSGMGESQHPDLGSGINNPDHIFESLETILLLFLGLKYLNSLMRIRDPGSRIRDGKKLDPRSGIRDKHPGSATLAERVANAIKPRSLLQQYVKT